jgi:predicted signal transduction protein with EAL and GGDEF domain
MSNNELLIDGNTSHAESIGRLMQQRIIGELTLIAGICVASWFLSQYLNIFEWVHEKTRGSNWLDEVLVVGCVFAVCFAIFCVRRWHEMRKEIASRLALQDKLVHDAHHDPLTQLPNSNIFLAQLAECVKKAQWPQDYRFGVVFVDVDRFKSVNDSFGHPTGDQLLVQISERLIRSCRQDDLVSRPADIIRRVQPAGNDILARLGGDEFVILLDDVRDPSDGIRAAERVQHNLLAPFLINGRELQITVSTGVAVSDTGFSAAEDVLRDADTAMYRAKALGKSQYQMCDAAMHVAAVTRLKLEDDLREATKNGELQVYFQPIVSLPDRFIRGFEALIRWQRPGLGLVAPGEFNLPSFVFNSLVTNRQSLSSRILAFGLRSSEHPIQDEGPMQRAKALVATVVDGSQELQLKLQPEVHLIEIDTGEISATDFDRMNEGAVKVLLAKGNAAARRFFDEELLLRALN